MRNFLKTFKLFSVSLSDSFKANRKGKASRILFPLFALAVYVCLFVVSMSYSMMFAHSLSENGLEYVSILMFYLAGIVVMLMMTTYKARGALFGAKDTEFLLSLPIPNSSLLTMRIMNMMFFNYLIGSLLVIPPSIVYTFFGGSINWAFLMLSLIFMPFVPTMFACIFGSIIGFTISKSKYKSIIEAVMSFIMIFVVFGFIANFSDVLESIFDIEGDVLGTFKKIYYPLTLMFDAVANGNALSMILFAVINIIALAAFIKLFNNLFVKINQNLSERYTNANYELKEAKKHGQLASLVIKEINLYTQSSMHMLNTCFGSVSILIFAMSTFFYDKSSILNAFSDFGIEVAPEEFTVLIGAIMIALSCTTPASISMEGKSLWCIRSMPVKEMTIFWSKMLVDICFVMPVNIVSALIIGHNFGVKAENMLLIAIFMALVGVCMTHFGILLNLLFPKLKFKAEVEVVKQSMAANLAVYIPLGISFISVFVYMTRKQSVPFTQFFVGYSILMVCVLMILSVIIRTYGVSKFKTLYC